MKEQFIDFLLYTLTTQGALVYIAGIWPLSWIAGRIADQFIPVASTSHVLLVIALFLLEIVIIISTMLLFLHFDIMGHLPLHKKTT